MASLNKKPSTPSITTHEGGKATIITPEQRLRRTMMCCLLWEDTFYEEGVDVAQRIADLTSIVPHDIVANLAIEARHNFKLRHAPLLLTVEAIKNGFGGKLAAETITKIIDRPDELGELLKIYWRNGKSPITNAMRKGLGNAFLKFNEYQLSKWSKNSAEITPRDVMFLTHPKPMNQEQVELFKKVADDTMAVADTWESELSAGKDKKETFERLIREKKLGGLALLRNQRNMVEANVDRDLIKSAIESMNTERILPFRFVAARKHTAPSLYDTLEKKFLESMTKSVPEKLSGKTVLLVDVSGSMSSPLSGKSDMNCCDAGGALAAICREVCEDVEIFKFDDTVTPVNNKHGFSLIDEFRPHGGTMLSHAIKEANKINYDRLIVITDEQSHDGCTQPNTKRSYMINVASYQNGVGYHGNWNHIDGWSEHIFQYIIEHEKMLSSES